MLLNGSKAFWGLLIFIIMDAIRKNGFHINYRELELYLLNPRTAKRGNAIRQHLQNCLVCREKFNRISLFHGILYNELATSIKPSVFDFCKCLAPPGTHYGLFICSAVPEKNNFYGNAYLAKLTFSVNGHLSPYQLSDFSLPTGMIGIIFYYDLQRNKLLLFPFSNEIRSFSHWTLTIPGILEKAAINPMGCVKIDHLDFEVLNHHLVFFKHNSIYHPKLSIIHLLQSSLE